LRLRFGNGAGWFVVAVIVSGPVFQAEGISQDRSFCARDPSPGGTAPGFGMTSQTREVSKLHDYPRFGSVLNTVI
jgi:hypothetical protein